jgi:hypothetical protein
MNKQLDVSVSISHDWLAAPFYMRLGIPDLEPPAYEC